MSNDAAVVMHEVQEMGANLDAFSEKNWGHRRGWLLTIPVGVSLGGGQTIRAQAFAGKYSRQFPIH